MQTFADQAVIAIENVRLFEQVQERTKELSLSLEDLRTAQDRLVQTEKLASLGQLTAGIAHEIKNPLNFVNNFSALSAELIDELDDALAFLNAGGRANAQAVLGDLGVGAASPQTSAEVGGTLAALDSATVQVQQLTGELVGASDRDVTIAAGDGVVTIPYEQIVRSNLVPGD